MKSYRSMVRAALALGLACALPVTAHAAIIYDEIVVNDVNGLVIGSVSVNPADIIANPDSIYYVPGVATDPSEYGTYGLVVDSLGNPLEFFGTAVGGPDLVDLAFGGQGLASELFPSFTVPDNGEPIDLTMYLDQGLQAAGDTATFIATVTAPVPEPMSWAMMLFGFGVIGYGLRRQPIVRTVFANG